MTHDDTTSRFGSTSRLSNKVRLLSKGSTMVQRQMRMAGWNHRLAEGGQIRPKELKARLIQVQVGRPRRIDTRTGLRLC